MRQANPKLVPRPFPCGAKGYLTPYVHPDEKIFGPVDNSPVNPIYPVLASAAETEAAPSRASRTYVVKTRDFHLPARWI